MSSTNASEPSLQQTKQLIFQVHCAVYIPLFIAGVIIHILGIIFHLKKSDALGGGSTIRIWTVSISLMEIVDLCYGGIYRTLTYAGYVPYIPVKPYLLLQYFIGGLTPLYTLGFTVEKMVAVTWPLHCSRWIRPRYVYFCLASTTVYLAIFCSLSTAFSFDWERKMMKTAAFIYFYCFECIVNIIFVGILHLVASVFIVRALVRATLTRGRLTQAVHLKPLRRNEQGTATASYQEVKQNDPSAQTCESDEIGLFMRKEYRICVIILLMNIGYFIFVLPYWTMWIPRNMGLIGGPFVDIANYVVRPMPWMYRLLDALFLYVIDKKFRLWIRQGISQLFGPKQH